VFVRKIASSKLAKTSRLQAVDAVIYLYGDICFRRTKLICNLKNLRRITASHNKRTVTTTLWDCLYKFINKSC
jgi:hypothetical protein